MKISVSMPSNIALLKYMGKKSGGKNQATNPSLSYTLDYLLSTVEIEPFDGETFWEPLPGSDYELSASGQTRYLDHFRFLLSTFDMEDSGYVVRSGNNFPSDCGIASSASSFAALTEAVCQMSGEVTGKSLDINEKSWLSSQGSGSSCRSFLPGWVLWDGDQIQTEKVSFENLGHMVLLASVEKKAVSSSEAHQRVATSSLMMERTHRVEKRLDTFVDGLNNSQWKQLYEIAWAEFWDMHALFETSQPPFGYFNGKSMEILQWARNFWETHSDGPLVTMDAGPNVHLLWRKDQKPLANRFFKDFVEGQISCFSNYPEIGFAKV